MRSVALSAAASAVSLASLASAQLDKPVIDPEFPGGGLGGLDQGLNDNLHAPGSSWEAWEEGWIPEDCKNMVEGSEFSVQDITPFNIKYDDCETPWVFCRHKDSPLSEDTIVDTFGKLPVRFRSFVRHMLFVPGTESAGSSGDNVQMNGELGVSVFIHEVAHSFDGHHGIPEIEGGFSASQAWLDAYNADSAVPDGYAQSSQAENFAQQTVVALFDSNVPDGVASVQPSWQSIENQFRLIQDRAADILRPDGTCTSRLENSPSVEKGGSAKLRPSASTKPDVSLKGKTKVIEPVAMGTEMEMAEYDANGKVVGTKVVKIGGRK